MENTVSSDLLLHDKPLIRKIIGWKWNWCLLWLAGEKIPALKATRARKMANTLNILEYDIDR